MPRQKLPDGWGYAVTYENVAELHGQWPKVSCTGQTVTIDEFAHAAEAPIPVILSVIRNAGADQVYEAAKRLVTEGPKGFCANFTALRELIEGSEEP